MQFKNQEDEIESKIGFDLFSGGIVTKPRTKRRWKWRLKRLTNRRTKREAKAEIESISEAKIGIETKPRRKRPMERSMKAKTEEKKPMTISMYRGNMHKVSDVPRVWPMPERTLSLKDFRSLLHRRKQALARRRIALNSNPSVKNELVTDREDVIPPERPGSPGEKIPVAVKREEEEKRDGFEGTRVGRSDDLDHSGRVEVILNKEADDIHGKSKVVEKPVDTANEKAEEVKETVEEANDREKRCKENEERLQVLYTKKHKLVQILKQICNAEEEFKRRSNVAQPRQGSQE